MEKKIAINYDKSVANKNAIHSLVQDIYRFYQEPENLKGFVEYMEKSHTKRN